MFSFCKNAIAPNTERDSYKKMSYFSTIFSHKKVVTYTFPRESLVEQ